MFFGLAIAPLLLFTVGALPWWRHSRHWGYIPSGTMGLFLTIVATLELLHWL